MALRGSPGHADDSGIIGTLLRAQELGFARRGPIDAAAVRGIARAIEQAGIRPPGRGRRAGDYELQKLLTEGEDWQDFAARQRTVVDGLDASQRLGLRDAALRHGIDLWLADPPVAANGSALIATLDSGAATTAWFTGDTLAAVIASGWGNGQTAPVVSGALTADVALAPLDPALLLPKTTTAVRVIEADKGRRLDRFGDWFATLVRDELEPLSLWRTGVLQEIRYSDRYLRSP